MQPKYLDHDNETRLAQGIVFYKKEPFQLQLISKTSANLLPLSLKQKPVQAKLTDKDIDVSSPELGYANYNNDAYYLRRLPARKYKQALNIGSCSASNVFGVWLDSHSLAIILYGESGYNMLCNRYPSYSEALAYILSRNGPLTRSIAFSKECCLSLHNGVIKVHIKGEEVGTYDSNTKKFSIIKNPFSWVTERILSRYAVPMNEE